MPQRHIGGSLLPSSTPHILEPIATPFGTLQVRALPDADTHALFHRHSAGESLLATHPNGYSCHELAVRMASRDETRVRAQAKYILDCGGTSRHVDHIVATMDLSK